MAFFMCQTLALLIRIEVLNGQLNKAYYAFIF